VSHINNCLSGSPQWHWLTLVCYTTSTILTTIMTSSTNCNLSRQCSGFYFRSRWCTWVHGFNANSDRYIPTFSTNLSNHLLKMIMKIYEPIPFQPLFHQKIFHEYLWTHTFATTIHHWAMDFDSILWKILTTSFLVIQWFPPYSASKSFP